MEGGDLHTCETCLPRQSIVLGVSDTVAVLQWWYHVRTCRQLVGVGGQCISGASGKLEKESLFCGYVKTRTTVRTAFVVNKTAFYNL